MAAPYKNLGTRKSKIVTSQSEQASDNQVKNNAGGFTFKLNDWDRLDRFLILGADSPTYYVGRNDMMKDNSKVVGRCLDADGIRTIDRIVDISVSGRAIKNEPALYALAVACSHTDDVVRSHALKQIVKVARTGTHLFHFVEYVNNHRGWGRALKRAVGNWYLNRSENDTAYQAIKYRQRDKWTHRDVLRLSHPKADTEVRAALFNWICGRETEIPKELSNIHGFEKAKDASVKEVVELIKDYNLPREAIVNTELLNEVDVWKAMLPNMPLMALVRNLGVMTANGTIKPLSKEEATVVFKLSDESSIKVSRLHPFSILLAWNTYKSGRGFRGSNTWTPNGQILSALEEAFYKAFVNVEATGKRHLLALDVSGSMGMATLNNTNVSAREASAAMALVTMKTEPSTHTVGFTSGSRFYGRHSSTKGNRGVAPLNFGKASTLGGVVSKVSGLPFGATDCAAPMLYAMDNDLEVDVFVIYTDNETWAGNIHPHQALRDYRKKTGINAKLIVVGMTATGFTIADPDDSGMLDIVGFDGSAPAVMANFIAD